MVNTLLVSWLWPGALPRPLRASIFALWLDEISGGRSCANLSPGLCAALLIMAAVPAWAQDASGPANDEETWSIVIHGGAGTIERSKITPQKDAEIRAALDNALSAGAKILEGGGSALDAVTAVITRLENNPDFNAGKGAVFTWEETNEMDASIMDGRTRDAGAVAGVTATKNPILLARKVMTDSPHVMLSGKGADIFSREQGLEQADPSYFATEPAIEADQGAEGEKGERCRCGL